MPDKLRIGIACYASYGGSGVVATEMGRELARLGHKVHFISANIPFRLMSGEFFENIYFHEVPSMVYDAMPAPSYGLEMASKIVQIANDEHLDILHAHYAVPHAISAIIAKQVLLPRDLKIVTTLHGTDITLVGNSPSFFPVTKWAIETSDAVTSVSNWLREQTVKAFAISKPIHVIHNFVDTRRFAPGGPKDHRQHFARPDEKIILHVSNFRPVKKLDVVINAFALLCAEIPARLILIGDGPERERTLELARKLGVMDRTWYLGRQNLIENYFSIADALLFPSEYESFGIAALEAMSCGVPVVGSQGSGLCEVVVDGITGFLRPADDAQAMAVALRTILTQPEVASRMAEEGRQRATCCFQSNIIMANYTNLYSDLLEGREPRAPKPCPWLNQGKV